MLRSMYIHNKNKILLAYATHVIISRPATDVQSQKQGVNTGIQKDRGEIRLHKKIARGCMMKHLSKRGEVR